MAIGKRVTDPIQAVSVKCDTAIDHDQTPILDYIESRDMSVVKALPGAKLTIFTLQPLRPALVAHCRTSGGQTALFEAFLFGCTACTDHELLGPNDFVGVGVERHLKQQAMDRLPDQIWQELGHVVLQLGELTLGEELRFGLPAGLPATRRRRSSTTAPSASDSARQEEG